VFTLNLSGSNSLKAIWPYFPIRLYPIDATSLRQCFLSQLEVGLILRTVAVPQGQRPLARKAGVHPTLLQPGLGDDTRISWAKVYDFSTSKSIPHSRDFHCLFDFKRRNGNQSNPWLFMQPVQVRNGPFHRLGYPFAHTSAREGNTQALFSEITEQQQPSDTSP
jgi:hypothetical protein